MIHTSLVVACLLNPFTIAALAVQIVITPHGERPAANVHAVPDGMPVITICLV